MDALELLEKLALKPKLIEKFTERRLIEKLSPIAVYTREQNPDIDYPDGFFLRMLDFWIGEQQSSAGDFCEVNATTVTREFKLVMERNDCQDQLLKVVVEAIVSVLGWAGCPVYAKKEAAKLMATNFMKSGDRVTARLKSAIKSAKTDRHLTASIAGMVVQRVGAGYCIDAVETAVMDAYPTQLEIVTRWIAIKTILRAAGSIVNEGEAYVVSAKKQKLSKLEAYKKICL